MVVQFLALWTGCGGGVVPYASVPSDAGPDGGDAGDCDPIDPDRARFAVIGDFGETSDREADVARVVDAWDPDFVVTTGDNNYVFGSEETIDENVGQYYARFIHPYDGEYGEGHPCENRFFPTLGNADWDVVREDGELPEPYLDYFTLPGNERYYDVRLGPVHLFALDADPREPDGVLWTGAQGAWLEGVLPASTAPLRIVAMHHSPLASGVTRGPQAEMHWPWSAWGASVVFSGHDHLYERILHDGRWQMVTGLGGRERRDDLDEPMAGSQAFFSDDYGAILADVDETAARFRFVTRGDVQIDEVTVPLAGPDFDESLVAAGASWRFLADGSSPGGRWNEADFDDSAWSVGGGPFGAGEDDDATSLPDPDVASAYFRTTFEIEDPARFASVDLRVLRDDGAIVHLNGDEVFRSNFPPASAVTGAREDGFVQAALDPGLLLAGTNVLAVEVQSIDPPDGDLSFECVVTARVAQTVVAAGSTWSFLDDGSDPGDDWRAEDFDDSSWATGAAPIGFGRPVVTATAPATTLYLRQSFEWTGESAGLLLRVRRDDGIVVWLDGEEIFRGGLPRGGVGPDTAAPFPALDPMSSAFVETSVDSDRLVSGWNVLAVEVHSSEGKTRDCAFDLEILSHP